MNRFFIFINYFLRKIREKFLIHFILFDNLLDRLKITGFSKNIIRICNIKNKFFIFINFKKTSF
ncbi:hypothetical protein AOE57_00850 [Candidatus Riesia pediculicola]|nr:hypothetical protein AOE57_00850 [Candidatus Riesia pediculicola]